VKVFDADIFCAHFRVHRRSFSDLKYLYLSRQFGKRRFLRQRQKQQFDDKFINKVVKVFSKAAGTNNFIVAYSDRSFPLAMKGLDFCCSAHERLMMLLSKRVRIIMTNECRTTKAFPKCRDKKLKMKCRIGNSLYFNRRQNRDYTRLSTNSPSVINVIHFSRMTTLHL